MSTSARRSPRNHSTTTMHPSSSNTVSSPVATSSSSTRHLASTSRNQTNHNNVVHPTRPRYSGSPKEPTRAGVSSPHVGVTSFPLNSVVTTSVSGGMMTSTSGSAGTSGLGIIGAGGITMQPSLSASGSGSGSCSITGNANGGSRDTTSNHTNTHGSIPKPPSIAHHFSPYHTRSTPNLTAGSTSGSSPVLLSPSTSPVLGLGPNLRESSTRSNQYGAKDVVHIAEPSEPGIYGEPPCTPTRNRRSGHPANTPKSPERETGMTPKYRAGYSVEGILMQSAGADKVNTNGNGLAAAGTLVGMGTRSGSRSVKGKGVDYGDR
jgi:hypothetical protein